MKNAIIGAVAACALAASLAHAAEKTKAKTDATALYKKNCAACHGAKMQGNPGMAKVFKLEPGLLDLKGKATAEKTDEALIKVVSEGSGKMPAYKKSLSAPEIAAIVAYLHPTAKAPPKPQAKP